MLNLKKTAIAVLAFSSSAVFAGTMGPICAPGNVTVPCDSSAWDFAAQALYLQPSSSGGSFVGSTASSSTVSTTGGNYSYQAPNRWGWGFKLEGSYHFNTGNDLDLNWYHVNRSSTFTPGTNFSNFSSSTFASGVSVTSKPQWDAVNLELGQHIDASQNSSLRLHGGVEYARLKRSQTINTTGVPATATTVTSWTNTMTYNGFGPRLGADLAYNWGNGLSIYSNSAMSLLTGSSKFSGNLVRGTTTAPFYTLSGSVTTLVPELEAKLGAMYTYALAQGDLSLDVGWMWVNYFNVHHFAATFGTSQPTTANFGVQGPYIGLKWLGSIA